MKILERTPIAVELLKYFWQQRLWWMLPMVAMLLLLGALIIFAQSSVVAPFIYTMF